jgi:hypothetical protein
MNLVFIVRPKFRKNIFQQTKPQNPTTPKPQNPKTPFIYCKNETNIIYVSRKLRGQKSKQFTGKKHSARTTKT